MSIFSSTFEKTLSLKRLLILVAVLFFPDAGTAQPRDPVAWFNKHFVKYDKNLSRALAAATTKLDSALELNDPAMEGMARMELGFIELHHTHDYEKAVEFFIQSLIIADSLERRDEQIFAYIALASVFEEVGNAVKSEELLEQAQMLNRGPQSPQLEAIILNRLGRMNALQGKVDEAFKTYELVLNLVDEINLPVLEAEALQNLAHLYIRRGEYDQALARHKRALAINRAIGDRIAEARVLSDIGELYLLMKNRERAFANHEAALEIRTALGDQEGIANSYNNLATLYFQDNDFDKAMANLRLSLAAARESQAMEEIRRAHEYLSLCYEAKGDFRSALENKKQFIDINDFIQRENTERQLLEAQSRYVIEGNQFRIRSLESIRAKREEELREQKRFRDFLIAVTALSTVIIFLIAYLYFTIRRSRRTLQVAHARVQEQNVQLRDLNATKDKFFSIISHDLKGPLNSLTSFSSLLINHTESLTRDEIKMLAADLDKSLKNLFALLENLLEWSRSQTGNIDFKAEKFSIVALLEENKTLLANQAQNKNITIENTSTSDIVVQAHKHSTNTVIRNLISNAIKFTGKDGSITVKATMADGHAVVSVTDSGVGMTAEIVARLFRLDAKHSTRGTADEKGTGLGLILCKEFVEKNGGRIWVESTPGVGSTFYFTVPATVKAAVTRS